MIPLDIRTLSVVTVLFSFIYGFGLLVYSKKQSHFDGLSVYGVGNLLAGLSFLLVSMRDVISNALSIVTANVLVQLSLFFMLWGVTKFIRVKTRFVGITLFVSVLLLIGLIYFTYVDSNTSMRIVILSLSLSVPCIFIGILLEQHKDREVGTLYTAMSVSFLLSSIFLMLRACLAFGMEPVSNFMDAGVIHGLTFLLFLYLIVSSNLLLILITGRKLESELEKQALTDPLTGLFNRRALDIRLKEEMSKSLRENRPLGIVLTDIDRFKLINDKYGHACGDEMLKQFTAIMKNIVRDGDVVARIGGEEFVILLSGLDGDSTFDIAERIRQNIENAHLWYGSTAINMTSSFGVTVFNGSTEESINAILGRADKALYMSKDNGRNRATLYVI